MDDFTGTRVEIHGADGYLVLEGDRLRTCLIRDGYEIPEVEQARPPEGTDELFGLGHIYEIADFVEAVRAGQPPPVPGADGRHLMAVLAAAYVSARDDHGVQVEYLSEYSDSIPQEEESVLWPASRDA